MISILEIALYKCQNYPSTIQCKEVPTSAHDFTRRVNKPNMSQPISKPISVKIITIETTSSAICLSHSFSQIVIDSVRVLSSDLY